MIKSGTRVGIILLVASWSIVHFVGRVLLLGVRSDPLVADHPLARDNRRHVLEGSLGVATLVDTDHNMRDLRAVSRLSECVRDYSCGATNQHTHATRISYESADRNDRTVSEGKRIKSFHHHSVFTLEHHSSTHRFTNTPGPSLRVRSPRA